ncbi:enoyl-CoA hydratase [Novosphingobium sp.]|uniref:enoyl-CoA hydratase n=1 Tax=Novosphingobium sp. TaxID=1874826 RepID=UPI003BA84624
MSSAPLTEYETLIVERPAAAVARIVMNRPRQRNAQDLQMTYELRDAFDRANADDTVKVIILAGADPHFSAGHDLQSDGPAALADYNHSGTWAGFGQPGAEGLYAREREIYLDMCERFRAIGKPTIAQVQGRCAAGGLMLAWVCDLIIASDDASFVDPVVALGVAGVEYFAHPFELGIRKAKELLFTADVFDAAEAHRIGMINHVVPRADLGQFTLAMAGRIAAKPAFALKMTKEAVNAAEDAMGRRQAMLSAFVIHQLCHAHNRQEFGAIIDPRGLGETVRKQFIERLRSELTGPQLSAVLANLGVAE